MKQDDSMFVPPWHEWSNEFINAEKWDQFNDQNVFKHPGGHESLPIEIARRVKEWKRPNEIFGTDELFILSKEDKNDIQDLLIINETLMNVKIYRWILYHLLLYSSRFKKEGSQIWHPSSLIFSCCKAVRTSWNKLSTPEYNPFGKYWLKLFYMGKFRMICVSDHLPLNSDGRVLLPLCKKKTVLWLPLLIKGLLRIYALADEFNQFNTITCLTGWSCIRRNFQHLLKEDIWLSILAHSSYAFSGNEAGNKNYAKRGVECFPTKTLEGTQCCQDETILNYGANPPNSIVIAVTLSPTFCNENNCNQNLQPIILNYVKLVKNKSIPSWKKYRWANWAVENNMIAQHELSDFTKSVNFYAPCTSLMKHTCPLMKILNKHKLFEDEIQYELDFSYLEPFAMSVEFYLKSSQAFPFVKSTYFRNKESPVNDIESLKNLSHINGDYDCVYLHFESPYCESMLFTLSVCKDFAIRNGNVVILDAPFNKTVDYPYIIVEQFLWYETKLPKPLATIRTRGVSNDVVKFEPGVNVLKVWGQMPTRYSLTIESTVDFSVHKTMQTVHEKLTNRPKSLTSRLASIKQIFSQLCAAEPNTGKHGQRLLKFYYSFMPRSSNQQANYLDKIEQFSTISKLVQTAVQECLEKNFPKDPYSMKDMYSELRELFQNKSLVQLKVSNTSEKSIIDQEEVQRPIRASPSRKKTNAMSRKSVHKSKAASMKNAQLQLKSVIANIVQDNMFEILCNVLNSDSIDLDEYYFKNDLLNHIVNINYDENTIKCIDSLLLFRLELNTHSTLELAPTIIQFSNENNNTCTIYFTLIDNDSQIEVTPTNINMNMFMVRRNHKGYTLLGWSSEYLSDNKCENYTFSFFGRPKQILHMCETQSTEFTKYDTKVCDKMSSATEYTTQKVQNVFIEPNTANVLARVHMTVENAAQYTIYFYLESLEAAAMEIRVYDKNNSSFMFASSRAYGKLTLIPIVFLDPNYNNTQANEDINDTENLTRTIFIVEVILIENIETDYINTRDDVSTDYDWTISCIYDQKLTDVTFETDIANNLHFLNPNDGLLKPFSDKNSEIQDENMILQPNLNHRSILESMMTKRDDFNQNITSHAIIHSTLLKDNNALKQILLDLSEKQNITRSAIKKDMDNKTKARRIILDGLYNKILDLLNIQIKPSSINAKQSRIARKKSEFR